MLFVSPLPLTSARSAAPARAARRRRVATCSLRHTNDDDVGWPHFNADEWARLDTLSGFEALCFRTQAALCKTAADADGLGTFDGVPSTATIRSGRTKRKVGARRMHGGLAFERAVVSVWRTPTTSHTRTRTGAGGGLADTSAVGLSVRMRPRDVRSPELRADVTYFESGGAWWWHGGTDLAMGAHSSPNVFAKDKRLFLQCVQPTPDFVGLPSTWDIRDVPAAAEGPDRVGAFAFVARVVDSVLPAYLPLVAGTDASLVNAPAPASDVAGRGRARVRYGLAGGASCESEIREHNAALAWWRFTLAPRVGTPQASLYQRMRDASR